MEHERLWEFASAQGQDDLLDYATRPKRTVIEVLKVDPLAACPSYFLA